MGIENLKGIFMKKLPLNLIIIITVPLLGLNINGENTDERKVELVKKIKPAVVLIETYDISNNPLRQGSGFFINKKGVLITNHHVIEGAYSATIKTSSGDIFQVENIVAADMDIDIAKLAAKITKGKIQFLHLSSSLPSVGEDVIVVGNPLGLESTVSTGIVSAVRKILRYGDFIQITAPISPGSSGGPVVNSKGEVVGIAASTIYPGLGQNLNFAVPSIKIINLKPIIGLKTLSIYADEISNPRSGFLPLVPGSHYVYSWREDWGHGTQNIRTFYIKEIDGICFIDETSFLRIASGEQRWDEWVYANINIGLGAYRRKGPRIFTFCIGMNCDPNLKNKEDMLKEQELLRLNLKIGDVFELHKDTIYTDLLKVIGFESISVPAGRFDNCVKLEILRTFISPFIKKQRTNKSYVWLAENVGLVRWERPTGRIDELVSFQIPKTAIQR